MLNEHPLYYKAPVQVVTIFLFSGGEITGGDAVAGDRLGFLKYAGSSTLDRYLPSCLGGGCSVFATKRLIILP